jgi:hypothetical protein
MMPMGWEDRAAWEVGVGSVSEFEMEMEFEREIREEIEREMREEKDAA